MLRLQSPPKKNVNKLSTYPPSNISLKSIFVPNMMLYVYNGIIEKKKITKQAFNNLNSKAKPVHIQYKSWTSHIIKATMHSSLLLQTGSSCETNHFLSRDYQPWERLI